MLAFALVSILEYKASPEIAFMLSQRIILFLTISLDHDFSVLFYTVVEVM